MLPPTLNAERPESQHRFPGDAVLPEPRAARVAARQRHAPPRRRQRVRLRRNELPPRPRRAPSRRTDRRARPWSASTSRSGRGPIGVGDAAAAKAPLRGIAMLGADSGGRPQGAARGAARPRQGRGAAAGRASRPGGARGAASASRSTSAPARSSLDKLTKAERAMGFDTAPGVEGAAGAGHLPRQRPAHRASWRSCSRARAASRSTWARNSRARAGRRPDLRRGRRGDDTGRSVAGR